LREGASPQFPIYRYKRNLMAEEINCQNSAKMPNLR
jgi:hypothetical protein